MSINLGQKTNKPPKNPNKPKPAPKFTKSSINRHKKNQFNDQNKILPHFSWRAKKMMKKIPKKKTNLKEFIQPKIQNWRETTKITNKLGRYRMDRPKFQFIWLEQSKFWLNRPKLPKCSIDLTKFPICLANWPKIDQKSNWIDQNNSNIRFNWPNFQFVGPNDPKLTKNPIELTKITNLLG